MNGEQFGILCGIILTVILELIIWKIYKSTKEKDNGKN